MFKSRKEAGYRLSRKLYELEIENAVVFAIPRGGVVVASQISKFLNIPLDLIVVRKLGYPHEPEFGFGAISENNTIYIDKKMLNAYKLTKEEIEKVEKIEKKELKRRIVLYKKGKKLQDLKNKTAIIVDDGLATGVSAKAAIEAIRKNNPKEIIFATPVAAASTAGEILKLVDEFVCLIKDVGLSAIGNYYKNFSQASDEYVLKILYQQGKN